MQVKYLIKLNKTMKITISIFMLMAFSSCNNLNTKEEKSDEPNETVISINHISKKENDLKDLIIQNGDTNAYYSLNILFLDSRPFQEEFLIYALIMANKYHYPQAYYDVFDCIILPFNSDMNQIDEESAKMAIKYLFLAAESGHYQATETIKKYSINSYENPKKQLLRIYPQ